MSEYTSVYVGKLPMNITRQEMNEIFTPYRPRRIDLRHGKSFDFGFVEVPSDFVDEVLQKMNRLFQFFFPPPPFSLHEHPFFLFLNRARSSLPSLPLVRLPDYDLHGNQLIVEVAHTTAATPRRDRLRHTPSPSLFPTQH